jgi:hypothetical protein
MGCRIGRCPAGQQQIDGGKARPNLMAHRPLQGGGDRPPCFVPFGRSELPCGAPAAPVVKERGKPVPVNAVQPGSNVVESCLGGCGRALDALAGQKRADGDQALANAPARFARARAALTSCKVTPSE